jgi:hypothetical protein
MFVLLNGQRVVLGLAERAKNLERAWHVARARRGRTPLSGTIIRGTLKTPNSQLVTPISIKLQRPDGYD